MDDFALHQSLKKVLLTRVCGLKVCITTVVAQRVRYFVLLNYTYKSWPIIKTRDSFGICLS